MDLKSNTNNDILHVSFNQDNTCLAVGTQTGFYVCDTNPLNLRFTRQFDEGIGIVEMLFRCNILALVGGGNRPRYQPNCVMIWDDHQERKIAELEFRSHVKAVKMRRDRIVVALENKIYIYNFEDLRLLHQFDTMNAKLGLVALSPTSSNIVLAFPSTVMGEVAWQMSDAQNADQKRTKAVTDSALEQIALDPSGTRLAVTSGKGTLIRIINLQSGNEEMVTYRRGTTNATIQCLAFSADSAFLACTSDHGTVHVFHLESANTSSSYFGMLTGTSEPRAVASYRVAETHSICAFVPSPAGDDIGAERKILVVLGASGAYYTLEVVRKQDGSFTINDLHYGETKTYHN